MNGTSLIPCPSCNEVIILGAGPCGLAAAITIARDHNMKVIVYERRLNLEDQCDENSYTVSINPRGLSVLKDYIGDSIVEKIVSTTLRRSSPSATEKEDTRMVEALSLRAGGPTWKEVARVKSGTVLGTTRGIVVSELYKHALNIDGIHFKLGYDLVNVDIESSKLTFCRNGPCDSVNQEEETVAVDYSSSRILDCTGSFSKLRQAVSDFDSSFKVDAIPWGVTWRNLYTEEGKTQTNLEDNVHYIFPNRAYCAPLSGSRWMFSLSIIDDDRWMLESQPTEELVLRLKAYVKEHLAPAAETLEEEEYYRFFKRRSFTGQVTKLNRLHYLEDIVFLGDAGHSVVPSTGEGINAAFEDVPILLEALLDAGAEPDGVGRWFEWFDALRIKDVNALGEYAEWCVRGHQITGDEKAKRTISMVLMGILKNFRLIGPTWHDMAYGECAGEVKKYSEMVEIWKGHQALVGPWSNRLLYWHHMFFGQGTEKIESSADTVPKPMVLGNHVLGNEDTKATQLTFNSKQA